MKRLLILLCLCLANSASGQFFAPQQKPMMGLQVNWAHPLSDGLVGYWLMNEGSGNKVFDLSGNGNTGTLVGNTHWTPGKFGSCLDFDGGADYVDCGEGDFVEGLSALSIVLWMKDREVPPSTTRRPLHKDDTVLIQHEIDQDIAFYVYDAGGSAGGIFTDGIVDADWHQVAGVFDGRYVTVYVDAIAGGTIGDFGGGTTIKTNTNNLYISSAGNALNGLIDNVMIYNRVLSSSEIAKLYSEPFCMFEPSFDLIMMYGAIPTSDWLGINSSYLMAGGAGVSCCHLGDGGNLLTEALDGTDYWYHLADEEHWFIIDLGEIYNVQKVRGRSLSNSDPTDVNIYVNNTGAAPWGDAVASGIITWQDTANWVEVDTTDKNGRYVLVKIVSTEQSTHILFGRSTPAFPIFDVYVMAAPSSVMPIMWYHYMYHGYIFLPILPFAIYHLWRRRCAA